jgi:hypothetical protein
MSAATLPPPRFSGDPSMFAADARRPTASRSCANGDARVAVAAPPGELGWR